MLWAGSATIAVLAVSIVNDVVGEPLGQAAKWVLSAVFASVPIAVLVVLLQRRLARSSIAGSGGRARRARAGIRSAGRARARARRSVARARVLVRGREPVRRRRRAARSSSRPRAAARVATVVERGGEPVAALVHDPALVENLELVESVCAAAALTLENERLQAELRARLAELRASRARLVEAGASRATADRARPPRRRAAAVDLDRDVARASRRRGCPTIRCPPPRSCAKHARRSGSRCRSCASSVRASTRASSANAASLPRSTSSRGAQRFPSRSHVAPAVAPAGPGRGGRLLRRQRGARERREAFARERRARRCGDPRTSARARGRRRRHRRGRAAPTARGCAGSPIVSRRSAARFTVTSPPGRGTTIKAELPCG